MGEICDEATIFCPMAAWIDTLNCWRGMSSLSLRVMPLPIDAAMSLCTMAASGGATSPAIRMSMRTRSFSR